MKQTMKELPASEQPMERLFHYGPLYLSDAELLAIIIHCGTKEKSALDIALDLLGYENGGLMNLVEMSISDLMKFDGIGRNKAVLLQATAELSRRISKSSSGNQPYMYNEQQIAAYYMEDLRHKKEEQLMASFFDAKCSFLGDYILSVGGSNFASFSPKDVFRKAIEKNAMYFVLLHNHPSGDPRPSQEDIETTDRIKKCGELMGISLADHIIIGDLAYYSFRQNHLI